MPLEQYIIDQITTNSITFLDLNSKNIGDAEAKELAEALKVNQSLIALHLHSNQIGDAGVQVLAETLKDNHSITTFHLSSNQIGPTGTQALAEALKVNHSITALHLSSNQIGDAGTQTLAQVLKDNHSITTLYLHSNQIGDVGAEALAQVLKINQSITTLVRNLKAAEKKLESIVKAKQAKHEAKDAKKEAERLEQEARLKEQEEAKAAKEAAKLKALEEAKVKEYIPDIPVVKLFEVAGGDNQFGNDDQATIKEISKLIRDGNDRLQEHGKQGILLLGNTGAGKSTLAHLLSGRKLQAIRDDETNKLVIDAMQPLDDIVIGHQMTSETKIPNKCFAKKVIIWDCPGFNDTDPVQEIANSFYIKRLFETTEQLKFVLVVPKSVLSSANASIG